MKINHLDILEVRKKRIERSNARSYQSVRPPKDKPFDLDDVFRFRGVEKPTHRQYSYMRQWLSTNNFVQYRITGRREQWHYGPALTEDQRREMLLRYPQFATYTIDSFVQIFFPGVRTPIHWKDKWQWEKIMRSRGLRPRMGGAYWSIKLMRRKTLRNPHPPAKGPSYTRWPRGSFCLWDLLELNKLPRTPENFAWAKQEIKRHGIQRVHGTQRYAKPDARGKLPATITGQWELPSLPVFTTYQFQRLNNALKPTAHEWTMALDFLRANGYNFDPQWKRWRKI